MHEENYHTRRGAFFNDPSEYFDMQQDVAANTTAAILGAMRGLYRASIFQPPDIPGVASETVALDDGRQRSNPRQNEIGDLRHCHPR